MLTIIVMTIIVGEVVEVVKVVKVAKKEHGVEMPETEMKSSTMEMPGTQPTA